MLFPVNVRLQTLLYLLSLLYVSCFVPHHYHSKPLASLTATSTESWYGDGLAFECTSCGRCCSGKTGSVRFTTEEAQGLADVLGITIDAFYQQYTRLGSLGRELKETREIEGSFDCIFLDRETQPGLALCKVYQNRPLQCKTWPFWPELLRDQASWKKAASSKYHERAIDVDEEGQNGCPGIDKGEKVPYSKIIQQLEDTIEWRTRTQRYGH